MKKHIIRYASFAFAILGMVSCSEEQETALRPQDAKSTPMTFLVSHPGQTTRATETSFEQNDRIGLYVADAKAQLEIANGQQPEPSTGTRAPILPMLTIPTWKM